MIQQDPDQYAPTYYNFFQGGIGDEHEYGTGGNDTLSGGAGDDWFRSFQGKDILRGESGNDELWGDLDDDTLYGGVGNDTLLGGDEHDLLYGEAGNDILEGNTGNDILFGGSGNDVLNGGSENDTLYGGIGRDKFAISGNLIGQRDLIADFTRSEDQIAVSSLNHYQLKYKSLNNIGTSKTDTLIYEGKNLVAIAQDVNLTASDFYIPTLANSNSLFSHIMNLIYENAPSGYSPPPGEIAKVFDPDTTAQYLASHHDLIGAFGNRQHSYEKSLDLAYQHYDEFGANENRSLDSFDESRYLASHNDLIGVFGNRQHSYERSLELATQHYIEFGASEGRALGSFNAASYLNNYADLRAAFGNDLELATQHYIEFGASEGRTF